MSFIHLLFPFLLTIFDNELIIVLWLSLISSFPILGKFPKENPLFLFMSMYTEVIIPIMERDKTVHFIPVLILNMRNTCLSRLLRYVELSITDWNSVVIQVIVLQYYWKVLVTSSSQRIGSMDSGTFSIMVTFSILRSWKLNWSLFIAPRITPVN